MKTNVFGIRIIYLMLIIYLISGLQFIFNETKYLSTIGRISYAEKLNFIDKQYYHNVYYKYYDWIDQLLPKDASFSIYYNKDSKTPYLKWEHKLNYYLYPRFVPFTGDSSRNTLYYQFKNYPVIVLLNPLDAHISHSGKMMYLSVGGKKYYCVAKLDDKYMFIEEGFIRRNVLKDIEWINIRGAFKRLYGYNIKKAVF